MFLVVCARISKAISRTYGPFLRTRLHIQSCIAYLVQIALLLKDHRLRI